uniref:Isochorismatase family protein n=1 Tax=candidate division WOR-3 bacterium TaxID=2052148 RepID=A0A7C2K4D2_UNCW3
MKKDKILIKAQPEPITIELSKSAIIFVDMQNAFVKKGGYFDLLGLLKEEVNNVIENCRILLEIARKAKLKVFFLKMVIEREREKNLTDTPFFIKSRGISFLGKYPHQVDKLYVKGHWGEEIIGELTPQEGEFVIEKRTYDGFIGTTLDLFLRNFDIKYLIFAGAFLNICIETTLRHAFCLGYFPIVVIDTTVHVGDEFLKESVLYTIKNYFGWITTLEDFKKVF